MTPPAAPSNDPSDRALRRYLLFVLGAAFIGLFVLAGVAGGLMVEAQNLTGWVEHTYVVESDVSGLQAQVERAETARRGFLLVPSASFQDRYQEAEAAIPGFLSRLKTETADNPRQQARVAELTALTRERAERVGSMMRSATSGDIDAAIEKFRQDRGQPVLTRIRLVSHDMFAEEQSLHKELTNREIGATRAFFASVVLGGAVLVVLTFVAVALMRRYARDLGVAQAALRRLNVDLEARVSVRTAELRRANDEIQRFAYIVSHDLRSPLVNVMGFTSELEIGLETVRRHLERAGPEALDAATRSALDVEMPEAIGFIRSSSEKMDNLINAILRLSREGRRTLAPERLDMETLMTGILDNVRHRLMERDANARIEGRLPPLVSDRLALEQIFGNLVDNAVKYLAPNRPGEILIRGGQEGDRVWYEVQDNGRGVDPKDHERVFELFRRSGVQDQPGEGIGLAHVRALVYRLDGRIDLTSELGRGAAFRLSFPAEPEHTT